MAVTIVSSVEQTTDRYIDASTDTPNEMNYLLVLYGLPTSAE